MELSRALLYFRTISQLRPAQILHRVRLRAQRAVVGRFPDCFEALLTRPAPSHVGWPNDFVPIDARLSWPSLEELELGKMTLLGQSRNLGSPPRWLDPEVEQLWRYHLHYWDWAWGLAQEPDRGRARAVFCQLLTSWTDQTHFGRWDEWSPYVVALRAWSWCGQYDTLVRGSDLEEPFVKAMRLHAKFLKWHLELDVGGNHLIKNLKALVGLGMFLGDRRLLERAMRSLEREVARQVLPDGGHFELAPAYHCQVLGDLVDLERLLGVKCPPWLSVVVPKMRRWLGTVLLPDGTVPLLNDGYPVDGLLVEALEPGPPSPPGLTLLPDSGLAVLRRSGLFVLADVGMPCPDELPAHAHADTLGFWFYAGLTQVVGEGGTSTYEAGWVRDYERGTAAHSTVQVDATNSTEVWGAFRAARRARPTVLHTNSEDSVIVLTASHDGYRFLRGRPIHTRTWVLDGTGLRVIDEVDGLGEHDLVVRFHGTPVEAVQTKSGELTERPTQTAVGWGRRRDSTLLEHAAHAKLPWRFEIVLSAERNE